MLAVPEVIPWIFVVTLFLPSFGGEVKVTIEAADEAACWKARGVVMREMRDLRKTATECAAKESP